MFALHGTNLTVPSSCLMQRESFKKRKTKGANENQEVKGKGKQNCAMYVFCVCVLCVCYAHVFAIRVCVRDTGVCSRRCVLCSCVRMCSQCSQCARCVRDYAWLQAGGCAQGVGSSCARARCARCARCVKGKGKGKRTDKNVYCVLCYIGFPTAVYCIDVKS